MLIPSHEKIVIDRKHSTDVIGSPKLHIFSIHSFSNFDLFIRTDIIPPLLPRKASGLCSIKVTVTLLLTSLPPASFFPPVGKYYGS